MKPKTSPRPGRPLPQRPSRRLVRLRVGALAGVPGRGRLLAGTSVIPCCLGPRGIVRRKREGDGATPAGAHRLVELLFRSDRGSPPCTGLPRRALRPQDGWCDDPGQARYNAAVTLPFGGSHERLWRDDRLYDVVVVLDYNRAPARKGRGSAIFLHVRSSPPAPTAGCVALEAAALRRLLARLGPQTRMLIV